ncbi:FtsX-like permease family protein [Amylolactobacillus amylophilus]|uniref:FtsX-like permease family protein n=1 Tax=Amylolactobacillus amylophilus TaxID=1603 RepID=UPI002093BEFB|nr:FtsX-like permease family protein [Amylolactobacillus amylophilus]
MGTGKTGMLIVTDSSADVPTVSKQLNKLFPKYQQKSRYALTHGEFAASYNKLLTMLIVGVLILTGLLTLIFVFLNRQLIGARRKELAILYSLGYSKTDVVKIIAGGIISQFVGIYLGATLIVYLLKTFLLDRFSYGAMFTSLYSFSNQIVIVIIMLIAIPISVLWGVSSVKKEKNSLRV